MKVIKFRAWLTAAKVILHEVTVYPSMIGIDADTLDEQLKACGLNIDDGDIWDSDHNHLVTILPGEDWYWIDGEKCNIMQFTGLLDKDKKEIYESDLLKDSRGQIWTVSWNDNHACFQVTCEQYGSVSEVIDNENVVVVGNIYQNQS